MSQHVHSRVTLSGHEYYHFTTPSFLPVGFRLATHCWDQLSIWSLMKLEKLPRFKPNMSSCAFVRYGMNLATSS